MFRFSFQFSHRLLESAPRRVTIHSKALSSIYIPSTDLTTPHAIHAMRLAGAGGGAAQPPPMGGG